jgi:hypothetical protein
MARNIFGGGSKTNESGLLFEQETRLVEALSHIDGYQITGNNVYYNSENVGIIVSKNALYTELLEPRGIHYRQILSKKLLPDDGIYLIKANTVYVIEKKFQNGGGSVDEKLQTCVFKLEEYQKLLSPLGIQVQYLYVLNDWFTQDCYRDVLAFIKNHDCNYFFNEIPLDFLSLPHLHRE